MTHVRFLPLLAIAILGLSGQTRRALVVGNSGYSNVAPVPTAVASARAIGRALTDCQFQVDLVINVEADALGREIGKFLQSLQPGDVGAFYFAGYAVQDMGENYLLPVGYTPGSADGIEFQSYSVKRLIRYLEAKGLATGLVVLDPAPPDGQIGQKFPEPGLASIDIRAANLVLAFANLPGKAVPLAPPGREISRYADAWVRAAARPGLNLDIAMRQIKRQVSQATNGEQVPAEISTLVREFAFIPRSPAAMEWDKVSSSSDPITLEAFRQRFPGDPLALEAAARIESLEWERVKAAADPKGVRDFLGRYPRHAGARQWLSTAESQEKNKASAAVLDAVARYAKAYENRDVDALQAIRPGFSPAERKRLEQAFKEFKSIRYNLEPAGEPAIDSTVATVKCRLKVEMRSNDGGNPRPVDQAVTVKLRRQSESWIIDTIQ